MKKIFILSVFVLFCTLSVFSQNIMIMTTGYDFLNGSEIELFWNGDYHDGFPLIIDRETGEEFSILFSEILEIIADDTANEQAVNEFCISITDIYGDYIDAAIPLEPGDDVFYYLDGEMMIPVEDMYLMSITNWDEDYDDDYYDDDYDDDYYYLDDYEPQYPEFSEMTAEDQEEFLDCFEYIIDLMDSYATNLLSADNAQEVVDAVNQVYDSMVIAIDKYPVYITYVEYIDVSEHPRGKKLMERWEGIMGKSMDIMMKLMDYEDDSRVIDALDKLEALNF